MRCIVLRASGSAGNHDFQLYVICGDRYRYVIGSCSTYDGMVDDCSEADPMREGKYMLRNIGNRVM